MNHLDHEVEKKQILDNNRKSGAEITLAWGSGVQSTRLAIQPQFRGSTSGMGVHHKGAFFLIFSQ